MKQGVFRSCAAAFLIALCLVLSCGGSEETSEDCTDRDRDGYGSGCPRGGDCYDNSAYIHPGALEACDGMDNNCSGVADETLPIVFTDQTLETVLISDLGLFPGSTVYNNDFCDRFVTSLSLDHHGIVSLNGIEYAQYLLGLLSLSDNNITDLSPLASLYNLQALTINQNPLLSDLGPLSGLPSLQLLSASTCNITSLAPLASLDNLSTLSINNNAGLSDLSPLAGLAGLQSLSAVNCNISSLKPLYDNAAFGAEDLLDVTGNPLDYISCCTYIPAMELRGVMVTDGCAYTCL